MQSAELRVLLPAALASTANIQIFEVQSPRRRRLLDERRVHLSATGAKWCEFDVGAAVERWLNGSRNLGIELHCTDCIESLRPLEAGLSVLVVPEVQVLRRQKRAARSYDEDDRTDCSSEKDKQCCRHKMKVEFAKLGRRTRSIVQPKNYEAYYCKGRCTNNYNVATNHSWIQNIMRRKGYHGDDKDRIPRPCCAPSKLDSLLVMRTDPKRSDKLVVETWENMVVRECACS